MRDDVIDREWLVRRRQTRRLTFGILLVGVVGFLLADAVGRPVLGVGIYWAGVLGFFAVRRWSDVSLADERDCELERRASYDALRIAAVALVVGAPATVVLREAGYLEFSPTLQGAIVGYIALFLVFGIAYVVRRYRP